MYPHTFVSLWQSHNSGSFVSAEEDDAGVGKRAWTSFADGITAQSCLCREWNVQESVVKFTSWLQTVSKIEKIENEIAWISHKQAFAEKFQNLGDRLLRMLSVKYIALVGENPCPLLLGGLFFRDAGSGKLICRMSSWILNFRQKITISPVVVS